MHIGEKTPAIVTGGASGLGEACARALRARGAPVAILDLQKDLGLTVATGIGARFIEADVTSDDSVTAALTEAAAAHGTANAKCVLEDIKAGGKLSECHFIEFMGCPGGCLGGGGQPIPTSPEIRAKRAEAIYA